MAFILHINAPLFLFIQAYFPLFGDRSTKKAPFSAQYYLPVTIQSKHNVHLELNRNYSFVSVTYLFIMCLMEFWWNLFCPFRFNPHICFFVSSSIQFACTIRMNFIFHNISILAIINDKAILKVYFQRIASFRVSLAMN